LSEEKAQSFLKSAVAQQGNHINIICEKRSQGRLLKKVATKMLKSGALHDPKGSRVKKLYVEYVRPSERNPGQGILTGFELKR